MKQEEVSYRKDPRDMIKKEEDMEDEEQIDTSSRRLYHPHQNQ